MAALGQKQTLRSLSDMSASCHKRTFLLRDRAGSIPPLGTVQQQLHASGLNERIEIRPYLTKLCASLAASMVGERRALSVKVLATTGGAVSSDAVSIGLIVTELVINALKHGFPTDAEGQILVSYDAQDTGWQLSVSDNGSGPKGSGRRAPTFGSRHKHCRGLGASAEGDGPEKTSGLQGTKVSIAASAINAGERLAVGAHDRLSPGRS